MTIAVPGVVHAKLLRREASSTVGGLVSYKSVHHGNAEDKARAFHYSDARIKVIFGGNRAGKSETCAVEVVSELEGTHPLQKSGKRPMPPLDWRAVGVDFQRGVMQFIIPKIRKYATPSKMEGGSFDSAFSAKEMVIRWKNGSMLELMSYEQDVDKFAGVDRDGTWFDEEPPFAIYQECQMRHIGKKGRTVLSFTADKGVTWVYDMFYLPWILGSLPSHIHCWRFSMRENRTLDPAEIELAAQSLPSEFDRRTKLDGEVVHRTGLVFPEFQNREPWVFNMFHIPTEWPRWVAIDPHPRKPHGLLLAALSPSGELWFYDCHLTSNTPAPNCHFLKAALKGLTPQVILIDPSSKGYDSKQGVSMFDDYLDELSYVGLDCGVEALKELDLGIVKMRTGFEWNPSLKSDRQIPYDIAPPAEANGGVLLHICRQTCAPLITQLLKYSYPALASRKSEDRGETVRKPKDKDNDLIDPMRYIRLDTLDWVPVVASPRRNIGMAVPGDDEDFEEFPDPEYETDWMEA